jgi:hypothetical protein
MMVAAAMGAVAFQKGLGAIHALSHPVGAVYNTHHGTTNAVVMPPCCTEPAGRSRSGIARAAAYLGISGGFDGFYNYVIKLRADLGIPKAGGPGRRARPDRRDDSHGARRSQRRRQSGEDCRGHRWCGLRLLYAGQGRRGPESDAVDLMLAGQWPDGWPELYAETQICDH